MSSMLSPRQSLQHIKTTPSTHMLNVTTHYTESHNSDGNPKNPKFTPRSPNSTRPQLKRALTNLILTPRSSYGKHFTNDLESHTGTCSENKIYLNRR